MATRSTRPKLLVVVGPTATGKTALAIQIAREFNGEIIAADSRTIYKAMDVGTAKPSVAEQARVPHWGLDLVEPGETFSAAQFQKYACAKIDGIQRRGRLPILVGGTGLYIDSVIFGFKFREAADANLRQKLEKLGIEELQALVTKKGYPMPENLRNRRHLIRTIESSGQIGGKSQKPKAGTAIIGLMPPAEVIKQRISARLAKNFELIIKETRVLLAKYGRQNIQKTAGIPYLTAIDYIDGKINAADAKKRILTDEWQYARRQRTWFKRNPHIKWFKSAEDAFSFFETI